MLKSFVAGAAALVSLSATTAVVQAETATWEMGNGHTYQVVLFDERGELTWQETRDAAAAMSFDGLTGHLATFTTEDEWNFVVDNLNEQALDLYLGGSDEAEPDVWRWVTGPEAGHLLDDGFTAWAAREPNNVGGIEAYLAGWSFFQEELWNDLPASSNAARGYLVEYSVPSAPVPLPAGLPLILAGFGAFGALRQLRRR